MAALLETNDVFGINEGDVGKKVIYFQNCFFLTDAQNVNKFRIDLWLSISIPIQRD